MNEEEIKEILDKLSNRKQETLLQGLRECQLKNIEHVFITREEYIDKTLNYINYLQVNNQKLNDQLDRELIKRARLEDKLHKIAKIIDSYNLGKYDYSIPPSGILEIQEVLGEKNDNR